MLYLTTPPPPEREAVYARHHIGVMVTPLMNNRPRDSWPYLAADNGCFTRPDRYADAGYLAWLDTVPRRALFATAPDVVGDWAATLDRSLPMLARIRATGHRAAIVLQEGVTSDVVPWAEVDAVFIGGGDAFKTDATTRACVAEAKRRGKWAHMGRVNSHRRLRQAAEMGCDSADGTYLAFGPDTNLPKLARWLRAVRTQTRMEMA